MNILTAISGMISPITKLVDELHTSEEEKQAAKQKIFQLQSKVFTQALDYEKNLIKAKADIVKAEAQGQSWIQSNWRPITMMFFLVLIGLYWFGLAPQYLIDNPDLVDSLFDLIKIGLGGYVVGRSAEKIAPAIRDMAGRPRD